MAENNYKPLPKTAFNEYKLRIAGPKQEGAERAPVLGVSVIKNNPRIDVFTNIPNDVDNGRISAPMDALTFMAVVSKLEHIIDGDPDSMIRISNKVGRPGETRIISTTIIGKDKEGRVYISVTAKDRPKIKFLFLPSEWHGFSHKDGTPLEEAEMTVVFARAWVRLMTELTPNVMNTYYTPPEPRGQGGAPAQQPQQKQTAGYTSEDFSKDDLPL